MTNAKYIYIVSYIEFPVYHGLSNRIKGIAKSLVSNGYHCKIICPGKTNETRKYQYSHITIHKIQSKLAYHQNGAPKFHQIIGVMLKALIYLMKLSRNKNDIIIVEQIAGIPVQILSKVFIRKKIFVDDLTLLHPDYKFAPKIILKLMDCLCILFSDLVITTTEKTKVFTQSIFPSRKCIVVKNGIDVHHKLNEKSNDHAIGQGPIQSIFVGGFGFHQNLIAVDHIFKILEMMNIEMGRVVVKIVGGPLSYVENYRNHKFVNQDIVIFTGRLADDELEREYQNALIGLLPFFHDTPLIAGQRTKALEYFARGLLVLSGPEGVGEITGVRPSESYIEVPNEEAFAKELATIIETPEKYSHIRVKGFEVVNNRYSWSTTTRPLITILKRLFNQNT